MHSDSVAYTFFNGDTSTHVLGGGPVNTTVAGVLQNLIVNFAERSEPSAGGVPEFEEYEEGRVWNLNITDLGKEYPDPDDNVRCKFWQEYS